MLTSLFSGFVTRFKGFAQREEGQGMVEYALIIAFIAIVAIAGLTVLGPIIRDYFITISGNL